MGSQTAQPNQQRGRDPQPGDSPAAGNWTCCPAEFWSGFSIRRLWLVRFAFPALVIWGAWALNYFVLYTDLFGGFPKVISFVILYLVVFALTFVFTSRSLVKSDSAKFHVTVKLHGDEFNTIVGGVINSATELKNNFRTPDTDNPHPFSSNSNAAVAFQNVLPRLYRLQHAVDGVHGLLKISESSGVWKFSCQRGPVRRCLSGALVWVIIPITLLSAITIVFDGQSVFGFEPLAISAKIAAGIIIFPSFIFFQYLRHRHTLSGRLYLEIKSRQGENNEIVDVEWTDYLGWQCDIHNQWAAFGSAECLMEFCRRAAIMSKEVRLTEIKVDAEPRSHEG